MSALVASERTGAQLAIYGFSKPGLGFYTRGEGDGRATADVYGGAAPPHGGELVNLTSSTSIGGGTGWQAVIKVPASFDLSRDIEIGAWAYISVLRHGIPYLIGAGRVTQRLMQEGSAGGASSRFITLGGMGFESIWRNTKWWFNTLRRDKPENETVGVLKSIGIERLLGSPRDNVYNILYQFLACIGDKGRATFTFPDTMPGVSSTALDEVLFDDLAYDTTTLPLTLPTGSGVFPNVDLWSMASEYQDGMFTEFWTDVLPVGGFAEYTRNPTLKSGLTPITGQMTFVFRDKPFPLTAAGIGLNRGNNSSYFRLPTHRLAREDVASMSLASSEEEIFNAFSFAPNGAQEGARFNVEMQYCNWKSVAQPTEGLKKLDGTSPYYAFNIAQQIDYNRKRLRDWYCLGAELVGGTIQLGCGRPEIKVGSRIVIAGDTPSENYTFYVESVRTSWSAGAGLTTVLEVTRGYRGTDAQHLARLESEILDYADSY